MAGLVEGAAVAGRYLPHRVFSAIRRLNSWNMASAPSPRRWCSSGVISGAVLYRFPGLRAVTIADFGCWPTASCP
jgi:hypothetical protein